MADLSMLLTSRSHASLSSEKLELMGKEAANLLVSNGVPLNESITKIASAHPDINSEQVTRVVEFANTAAYLAFHDKNKTAGAESSYPQFKLADAGFVLGELNGVGQATKVASRDVSYSKTPVLKKVASAREETALEELFLGKGREREKTASLDLSTNSVAGNVVSMKEYLTGVKNNLESAGERFDLMKKQAEVEYYETVKEHLLDGGSFADVLRATQEVPVEVTKVGELLRPVIDRLIVEKVASIDTLHAGARDLTKVAHRVVDETHPFVTSFGAIVSFDEEVTKVAGALADVDEQLARVKSFIREEFLARR